MRVHATTTGHLDDDRLTDLAHDLLDAAGAQECYAHLRICASCEARFREQVRLRERLRAAPMPALGAPHQAPVSRRRLRAALVAAAAVLLVAAVAPLVLRGRTPQVADYWLPLDRGEVAVRAWSPSDATDELRAAFEAYAERDAARALELFERAEVPETHRQLRELFRASALLLEDRPGQARDTLEALPLNAMPEPWRNRANWLLYTALRRTGEDERAAELLGRLAALPGEIGDLARAESAPAGAAPPAQPAGPKSTNPAQ